MDRGRRPDGLRARRAAAGRARAIEKGEDGMTTAMGLFWRRAIEAYGDPRLSARRILEAKPGPLDALSMALLAVCLTLIAQFLAAEVSPNFNAGRSPVSQEASQDPATGAGPSASGEQGGYDAAGERASEADGPVRHVLETVGIQFLVFAGVATMTFFVGAQFGGRASFNDCLAVVGWHTLATAPLEIALIAVIAALPEADAGAAPLLAMGLFVYILYLFAAFVAEAHGFKQVGTVMAAAFGIGLGVAFVTVLLLAGTGVLELQNDV